ncbi:MAG: hypothetical protein V4706_02945 [Pseudomonadota bacterium]
MKITLIHPAQVAANNGKKVEQHPAGAKLNIDDDQAKRLISNGYAKADKDEEEDPNPAGGAGGTGGGGNQNGGAGGTGGAGANGASGSNTQT